MIIIISLLMIITVKMGFARSSPPSSCVGAPVVSLSRVGYLQGAAGVIVSAASYRKIAKFTLLLM